MCENKKVGIINHGTLPASIVHVVSTTFTVLPVGFMFIFMNIFEHKFVIWQLSSFPIWANPTSDKGTYSSIENN